MFRYIAYFRARLLYIHAMHLNTYFMYFPCIIHTYDEFEVCAAFAVNFETNLSSLITLWIECRGGESIIRNAYFSRWFSVCQFWSIRLRWLHSKGHTIRNVYTQIHFASLCNFFYSIIVKFGCYFFVLFTFVLRRFRRVRFGSFI